MTLLVPSGPVRTDPAWPDPLPLLLGPDAEGLLGAVADAAGARLVSWRPRQVTHQPGRSTMVQYRADLRRPDGTDVTETLVAAVGSDVSPDRAAVFDDGATRVTVWRWTDDPFLPGLRDALDERRVAGLLDELGIGGGVVQLRTRAYRPGRRAVVEASGSRGRLFVKVVRPDRAPALHDVHRSLAGRLPVPESLGWTDDGVVVLQAMPGRTLRDVLRTGSSPVPPPSAVTGLLDRLPAELADRPPRRDLRTAVVHHAGVLAATVPESRPWLDEHVPELLSPDEGDDEPLVPVHGDLYESQLLVERGHVTGLLDVDTAGAGRRSDDLANACAHLAVLALVERRRRAVDRYGAALLAHAEQTFDRRVVRRRIAAAIVGLATGPFRVLESDWERQTVRRLELAGRWLGSADAGRRPG